MMNQIKNDISNILNSIGFKVQQVSMTLLTNYKKCNNCTNNTPHLAVFPCSHKVCTKCVDKLADAFEGKIDTILICPYCNATVSEIEYE